MKNVTKIAVQDLDGYLCGSILIANIVGKVQNKSEWVLVLIIQRSEPS